MLAVIVEQELTQGNAGETSLSVFRENFLGVVDVLAESLWVEIFDVIVLSKFFEFFAGVSFGVIKCADENSNTDHDGADANNREQCAFAPGEFVFDFETVTTGAR